jgi:CHAD domain-containing protein
VRFKWRVAGSQLINQILKVFGNMDAKDLLLNALDECGATYRKSLKRCRSEFSKDAVHDLRTSIRRLQATLAVSAYFTSASRIEKLSDRLENQLDGFSDLRDIQVMLDKVSEDTDKIPELEPFRDQLKKCEKRKQRTDEKHVQTIKPGSIKKRMLKIREALEDLSAGEFDGKLPQAVDEAYLTVLQRYGELDPSQLVSIHHLRVAFKNFRYRVEMIYPCLPDFQEGLLTRMHGYLDQMGTIHDGQVLLETLAEFAEEDDSYDPEPARRFYEQSLTDKVSEYLKNKADVLRFWRLSPLDSFPWQKKQKKRGE